MQKLNVALLLVVLSLVFSCTTDYRNQKKDDFVKVKQGLFIRNGKPYYYVGTNFWYGAILASEGEGGNRERLCRELDSLKNIGIDNLRILVGADGKRGVPNKVEPTLQVSPGVYNDTILAGLDYLLYEMKKRDMLAVLYLNNSWEWSGGYSQYLEWAGKGKAPIPSIDGYDAFKNYVKQFVECDKAKSLFAKHVNYILSRTNRYTNVKYIDDPTIMSWQIGNEPRSFTAENKILFSDWLKDVSKLIKSKDPNHLVSIGSEGEKGCEGDILLYEKIHSDINIDYMTIHIWPKNWKWISSHTTDQDLIIAKQKTKEYIDKHLSLAEKYGKPLVLEEFGYPRDNFQYSKSSSVRCRNEYYRYVFELLDDYIDNNHLFVGCNFWGWGGLATLSEGSSQWSFGQDYTGDPAQEPQGLNSVFMSDLSTINVITSAIYELKK